MEKLTTGWLSEEWFDGSIEGAAPLFNDVYVLEAGKNAVNLDVLGTGVLNVFGNVTGLDIAANGVVAAGQNARVQFVNVLNDARFDLFANADAADVAVNEGTVNVLAGGDLINATVAGVDAASTGNIFVNADGYAQNVTVAAFGQLHVNGIVEDTNVFANGYMGIGNGGKAWDTNVIGGTFNVFAGGIADDVNVAAGEATIWGNVEDLNAIGGVTTVQAGGFAVDTEINGGYVIVAGNGNVNNVDVNTTAGMTLYAGANVSGDIEMSARSAVNTFGNSLANANFVFDVTGGRPNPFNPNQVLDKVYIDDLSAFAGSVGLTIEVDSRLAQGRYILAGNAAGTWGSTAWITDDDFGPVAVAVGGVGAYLNNQTYVLNVDANNNLYLDVYDGEVWGPAYVSNNSVGAGNFGAAGVQNVWKSGEVYGITGMGTYQGAGTFAGIGDFNGDSVADLLFVNGNDIVVTYLFNTDNNTDNIMDFENHTYANALAGGTMADFQIARYAGSTADAIYVKHAGFYEQAVLFDATKAGAEAYTKTTVGWTTAIA